MEEEIMETDVEDTGQKYQKHNKYLKFLPEAQLEVLEEDADQFFETVKLKLTEAVLMKDIKQGARFWSHQLMRYIKLYGLRITKEVHINLVKLMFELVVTPNQEISVTYSFYVAFDKLLKERRLLSPDDLSLPWRPAFTLWKSVIDSKIDRYGQRFLPPYAENMASNFVKTARLYFDANATQEMLDEWRPYHCPFDSAMCDKFEIYSLFLPTSGPVERHDRMYRLWFDEFMEYYKNLDSSGVGWETKLANLFSRLAGHNVGLIDWEPHVPYLFSRLLKGLGLPVGPSKYQMPHGDSSLDFTSVCLWMIAMITPQNSVLEHISQLIKTIEPFVHPSNFGWWQKNLNQLISKLCGMFAVRIRIERYKKPSWELYIPEDKKITDAQITQFVEIMKPVVFTAMFGKLGSFEMAGALYNLAFLRPEKVIPQHLENLYPALENLTEPHRLQATLNGTMVISRALMSSPKWYPEGRLHVIPIMQLCLPGIDSNDSKKTMTTLQLVTSLASLIPLADCSEAYQHRDDLTETEREICSQTAQLQDFIFIFIDRIISLIEGLSLDHHESAAAREKASSIEAVIEAVLKTAAIAVFQQTSLTLFTLAFDKIWNYISSSVFEVLVAGRLAASLMYGVMRAQADYTVPRVIPHCCQKIMELTENQEVLTDPRADNNLLWNMLLLSESLRIDGAPLVSYMDQIKSVLDRTLHMTNTTAHTYACNILERYMKSIGSVYPTDFSSVGKSLDTPLSEYLPIRDWGKSFPLKDLEVSWHIPSQQSLEVLNDLLTHCLLRELEHLDNNTECDREDLQRRLRIIIECIKGTGLYLPPLESEEYVIESEAIVNKTRCFVRGPLHSFTISFNGKNVRNRILETIKPLMERLLTTEKDSAKPLALIASVYRHLLLCFSVDNDLLNSRQKSVESMKKALENPLMGSRSRVRMVHVELAYIQQCKLLLNQARLDPFTKLHAAIYDDLLRLATSRYDDVQSTSRTVLTKCFQEFKGSGRLLVPGVCKLLVTPPPEVTEEQFKGALGFVLNLEGSIIKGGNAYNSFAVMRDYVIIRHIWPAIIQAQHSEKPDIQSLVDKILKRIEQNFETVSFSFPVTEGSHNAALALRSGDVSSLDLSAGQRAATERTEKYQRLHSEMLSELLTLVNSDNIQWKHKEYAQEMIVFLQRYDQKTSLEEMKLFTDSLIHDSVGVRRLGIGAVTGKLYITKKKAPKKTIQASELTGYGDLQYNTACIPNTEEKWNTGVFVEKTFWGCTHWPKEFPVSVCMQTPTVEELDEIEKYPLDCFSKIEFTEKLFKYLSIEGKERENFSSRNYTLFKMLARKYGPVIIDCCKSSISKLLEDTDHQTEVGRLRSVAEFCAGVIRGAKYWTFKQMNDMYDWILPVMKKAITNISNDSVPHWGTAFATCSEDREPKKYYRLILFLVDEVKEMSHVRDSATSLELTSRLYFLEGFLNQQEWRAPELNRFAMELVKEMIASPFKSIRSRLGSVLCSSFMCDVPSINKKCWDNPQREEILKYCLPLVKDLEDSSEAELGATAAADVLEQMSSGSPMSVSSPEGMEIDIPDQKNEVCQSHDPTDSKEQSKLMLKTLLSWLQVNFDRHVMYQKWTKDILQFIPIICPHTANFSDPELRTLSLTAVKFMSKVILPTHLVSEFIHVIKETIGLSSWHARLTVLEILQSMIFLNQFILKDHVTEIQDMVVHLLSDEQMEVKLIAAQTLSGGIQCKFFDVMNTDLISHFKKLAKIKLKSKDNPLSNVQQCLAGVLGLGALVRAYPYDVPEFLPEVLMILSNHVHGPQSIQKTAKDVLSDFKRTHHDNWTDHKLKFSDDQLVVLTNLLVSPNYYA